MAAVRTGHVPAVHLVGAGFPAIDRARRPRLSDPLRQVPLAPHAVQTRPARSPGFEVDGEHPGVKARVEKLNRFGFVRRLRIRLRRVSERVRGAFHNAHNETSRFFFAAVFFKTNGLL